MNYYKDIERDKYVLKMEKSELTDELKSDLRKVCLWSSFAKSWVSRATLHSNNIKKFLFVMNKYNITEIEEHSQYTSEEIQSKRLKAIEKSISNLEEKADRLQAEFNSHKGDNSFFTQPNISTAGGRKFTNYRNRVLQNYDKGVELQIKAEEKKERLEELKNTLTMKELRENYYTIKDVAKLLKKTVQTVRSNYMFTSDIKEWKYKHCSDGVDRYIIKKEDFERIYIQNDFNKLRNKIKADRLKR